MSNTGLNLDPSAPTLQGPHRLNLSTRAKWKLTGPDRLRYLHGQTTNDLVHLPEGAACRAAVLDAKGRFQGEIFVAKTAEALLIDGPGPLRETLGRRLERYLVADDAFLEDITDRFHLIHLRPPQPPTETLAFASPRFLEPGTDLWLPADTPLPFPCTSEAEAEPLRILRCLPAWGREIDNTTLVPEVLYDRLATSYTKGCYIGQEMVARLKSIGRVNRELRLLRAASPPSVLPPFELHNEATPAGRLTSLAADPASSGSIALALVHRKCLAPGTVLSGGGTIWTVQPLPDFDIPLSQG